MFDNQSDSLHYNNYQLAMVETDETDNILSLSRELTDLDRNKIFQPGTVYITDCINPIVWDSWLFT